jgi:hypothetical protein
MPDAGGGKLRVLRRVGDNALRTWRWMQEGETQEHITG